MVSRSPQLAVGAGHVGGVRVVQRGATTNISLAQLIRRYRQTHSGTNRASSPRIQAAVPPSELGTPPTSAYDRAVFAVSVTGLTFAKACSQPGMLDTGTKTELANTRGKMTTKPADCAASAPRTVSATKAKIQLSANPKALTTAMQASALSSPAWKRKPIA